MDEKKYDDIIEYETPPYRPRKRKFTDRKDGRRIRTLPSVSQMIPFIMKERNDAQNLFEDVIDITNIERYLDEKKNEGYTDMTIFHVIIAAYVRVVAERPGINRFLSGQRVYARHNIECTTMIKKDMKLTSPDTCIKVALDPRDNIYNVYKKFQKVVVEAKEEKTNFDSTAGILSKIPRPLLRFTISFLKWLDYHGLLPKALLRVSPFHGSVMFSAVGSLGIPAIYHHLYNFGNLPLYLSYGSIFTADAIKRDGARERHHFVTFKAVTDERVCDGYYYASAIKSLKKYLQHPERLDNILDEVAEDID
jgi:hypothetical protein